MGFEICNCFLDHAVIWRMRRQLCGPCIILGRCNSIYLHSRAI